MQETLSIYRERIEHYRAQQERIARQLSLIAFVRLLIFFVFAWFIYSTVHNRFTGREWLYAVSCIPVFLIFLLIANRKKSKSRFLQQLVRINENEIQVSCGQVSFLDNGIGHITRHSFTEDLNLFGNLSLFHLLNRAGSAPGKEQLTQRLNEPFIDAASIEAYQGAAKELAAKIEFRQTLLANTLLLEEEEALGQLRTAIPLPLFSVFQNSFWSSLAVVWPIIGLLVLLYAVIADDYRWLLACIILGLLLLGLVFSKVNQLYNHISKRGYLYNQYAHCFRLIGQESFQHPYLLEKQQTIQAAAAAFKRLSKISNMFDLRMSALSLPLNGLFLLDLICSRNYLAWSKQYQSSIPAWFDALGEIELLNSLGTFTYNHPTFLFPQPIEGNLSIDATGMGHPLMKEDAAVVNDIQIGQPNKLQIITGSNMWGKSTFLRTLGLNMILAQCGAPVFAQSFRFTPVRFLTSFHHIDSLSESTSYFYAELKALQQIIQSLDNPVPALVLLDEVMRGTNSKDKHDGTALLIKKILRYPALTLIATHDTELGILADDYPGEIENFCFESELSGEGLIFDFTKRKGVAQSTNATYLMQQMGII